MIKKILKKKTSLAILTLLVIMIFGITINQSLAYFTAYCDAWGSKTLSLSRTTELNEDIVDNNKDCRAYTIAYSTSRQYQDKLKGFCDNVVEPLVNHIDSNYERIFIEMGLDEQSKFKIINNGGQVNIAKDDSNINAIQINNSQLDNLVQNVKNKIEDIDDEEIKSEIIDTVEGIQEELKKPAIKKGRIKSFISSLQTKLPSISTAIEVGAAITELITFAQQFIK